MRVFCLILICTLFFVSCNDAYRTQNELKVATWNSYLFFDSIDDRVEYDGFKWSDGYTPEAFYKRIESTIKYIDRNFRDPDLILLQEVESEIVLKELLERGLKRRGYKYYGLLKDDDNTLFVGFISKIKPISFSYHQAGSSRRILKLSFNLNGERVNVLSLHASSRLKEENALKRAEEFSLLSTLFEEERGELAFALGDFNSDFRVPGELISSDKDAVIQVTGNRGLASERLLYAPVLDRDLSLGEGTYWYEGEWSFLDSALLNKESVDGLGWDFESISVISPFEGRDYFSRPLKYDVKSGEGYSDHFALLMTFKYN